ncbi:NAD-dependent epimerase/dehydratase family protein [Aliivibrio fischeri]|uniref:NAD-dependent epimerase/dehydratase family protein n=1 Tax=Aliivibrio fischeri TaxID=668 RepID=UPI0012D99C00|nr:SDR family oxidoreductase [Aliivibrio fischeri]MUH96725.1 NAD-dependent epimerase/dehydratase family protein [Aliivibrio fischeri]MUI63801.1 NAD-dependent epimerase/dehydratase family protein [Aliivibrio fischeri]
MSKFTVFGGRGFIGSAFVKELRTQGHDVFVPEREDLSIYEDDLGTVIYSAGYGDCQNDPFNVLQANVVLLSSLLEKSKFNQLVYISSTRVYMNQDESFEDSDVTVCSKDNRRLFNLTKLTAEELCLRSTRECLIIRPSNVYGLALDSNLFLPSIIRDAINNRVVNMYVPKNYAKDYIYVNDLVKDVLYILSINRSQCIYNIGSGVNITSQQLANIIQDKTACDIIWHENSCEETFPITSIVLKNRKKRSVLDDLSTMIADFKKEL